MTKRRVLISGAGVAGATLGFWLARLGWEVTVVERAHSQRSSGNPVDIRGDALGIVGEMGLLDRLRASATTARRAVIVGADGSPRAHLGSQNAARPGSSTGEIEIPRADLAGVLVEAISSDTDVRYGESIAALGTHAGGVEVTFRSGRHGVFDVVIGADGVHSNTRTIAFGPAHARHTYLGLYVATTQAPDLEVDPDEIQIYNEPGRMVSIHPGQNSPIIAYMFRRPRAAAFDGNNIAAHKAMIAEAFDDAGWRTPELLEHTQAAPDVYLDAITRVTMPSWHTGRIALVGDAASCVSLLGDGSTKAIIGAHTLAAELGSTLDHSAAFRRYQHLHRRRVSSATAVRASARLLVPATGFGATVRNRALSLVMRPRASQTGDGVGSEKHGAPLGRRR